MPDLSSLLRKIPDEFKPWAAICIGAFILVGVVLFHGFGLHRVLLQHKRGERRLRAGRPHLFAATFLFGWAVFLMLTLHIAEIMIWAFTLLYLGLIPRPENAIYFCANAYTTLGYGNVDLGAHWRNLSPIMGISGLFTFAWTTSSLVNVVGAHTRLLEQLEDEQEKQMAMRAAAREAERRALTAERDAEREAQDQARKQAAGRPLLERRKIWKEERRKIKELRAAESEEIERIRSKERADEEGLGKSASQKDSAGQE
jgi:hypothetical protein